MDSGARLAAGPSRRRHRNWWSGSGRLPQPCHRDARAWISLAGGLWFIVGRAVADQLGLIDVSVRPLTDGAGTWAELSQFAGIGALVVFFAAVSIGRMSVRSLRDIRRADAPVSILESESASLDDSAEAQHVQQPPTANAPDVRAEPSPRRRLADVFGRRHASRE